MGLLDMFGAGGGTLTMQLQQMQCAPGQTIQGVVTFTGGKRAQNITSIKVRLSMTETHPAMPGKPAPAPHTMNVVPEQTLSGAFSVQPGTPCAFQFQMQLPPQMKPEVKGQIDYRIGASADIPGEVDQHANVDIQVIGGGPMGMGMGQPMQQPMMQKSMGTPQIGEAVTGEHPMGGWHPGKIVAIQNGALGVDWDDPKLGQSTWLQPHQVRAAAIGMNKGMGMPMGKTDAQGMGGMQQMGKPGALEIGHSVMAEHPKVGGWHPGKVVAMQNGAIGVDWSDAKLGDSSWLQPHQVQPGK